MSRTKQPSSFFRLPRRPVVAFDSYFVALGEERVRGSFAEIAKTALSLLAGNLGKTPCPYHSHTRLAPNHGQVWPANEIMACILYLLSDSSFTLPDGDVTRLLGPVFLNRFLGSVGQHLHFPAGAAPHGSNKTRKRETCSFPNEAFLVQWSVKREE